VTFLLGCIFETNENPNEKLPSSENFSDYMLQLFLRKSLQIVRENTEIITTVNPNFTYQKPTQTQFVAQPSAPSRMIYKKSAHEEMTDASKGCNIY